MMKTDGVAMLKLPSIMGSGTIHPTLFWDKQSAVLVDTGFPGQLPLLKDELLKEGIKLEQIAAIIITHQDIDHVGCLRDLLDAYPNKIEVIAHAAEKPYIQGDLPPIKLAQLEVNLKNMKGPEAEQMKSLYEKMKDTFPKLKAPVTRTVEDGEVLPYCGGLKIVYSPGHTPGHISIYHIPSKTLIAGDAMNMTEGGLTPPPDRSTLDRDLAAESLRKFVALDIQSVICYHGGLCADNANGQIAKITGQA